MAERLGFAAGRADGERPASVLLQIGQRSMKRLWRQKVGTQSSLGAPCAPRGGLPGFDARPNMLRWALGARVRIGVACHPLVLR